MCLIVIYALKLAKYELTPTTNRPFLYFAGDAKMRQKEKEEEGEKTGEDGSFSESRGGG